MSMSVEEYYELQENTIEANKNSYEIRDGVKYINIAECDRMYWNATSIVETVLEDLNDLGIDNHINHLSFSKLNKLLCRIINRYEINKLDKKVKDWFIRNNSQWNKVAGIEKVNNRIVNKAIRENFVFYYDNKHSQLYR